jgi:hypothetical protein
MPTKGTSRTGKPEKPAQPAGGNAGGGAERRQHRRVVAGGPCVLVDAAGKRADFEIMDLSESGVRLRCAHALPAMTRVGVVLVLPAARVGGQGDRRLDTQGVVVWSHEAEPGAFDTGVFFPELDDSARTVLKAYVTASV